MNAIWHGCRSRQALRAALLGVIVLLAGCATPQSRLLAIVPPEVGKAELTEVPFFPQLQYQCGPAALATVMSATGIDITPEQLAPHVYLPQRQGSLQIEMMSAPRRHGMLSLRLAPQLSDVLAEVAAGNPVIVLQNLALDWYPMWHYAVVVGYDLENRTIILRSGETRRLVLPLTTFERTWARSKHWAMLALPPHTLPQTVEHQPYMQAVIALEKAGFTADALVAYETALGKWPDNLTALIVAGNTAYAQGDHAASERAFRRAAEIHPTSDAALNNLAQILADQGRIAEAQELAHRALALRGSNSVAAEQTLMEIQDRAGART
jgi:hypothetical protein